MILFTKRNLKIFFRDKSAVFFSLLAVFIVLGLYILFLGDVWANSLTELKNPKLLMNSWIMAGLLGVTSVTTTMGAFGIMVDDKVKKISKDFYTAPVKRSAFVGGYVASSFIIAILMSLVTLVVAELYLVCSGGEMLSIIDLLKVLGIILISSISNSAMILFIVSFFKSANAFATASTIIGTLIGFLTGIYLPIGQLPESVQYVVKFFPPSHAVALFRQVIMNSFMETSFQGIPIEYLNDFKEEMGVSYTLFGSTVTPAISVVFLLVSAVIFFGLSVLNMSRKSK